MSDERAVSLQYDFGVTSNALAGKLLQLIGAASEDNVQGQAVLALRALGSFVHCSSELIGNAVDALNGNDNVNLLRLKLVIGVQTGGTAQILRQTTPGVVGFLIITALRLTYNDDEIGEVLYYMARETGVLKSWPASSQQFAQLAQALSGHSCKLMPIEHLCNISSALAAPLNQEDDMVVVEGAIRDAQPEDFAKILTQISTALLDENVAKVTLEGETGACQIATILTWLMPDQMLVVRGHEIIYGKPGAKLTMKLQEKGIGRGAIIHRKWMITKWNQDDSVLDFIEQKEGFAQRQHRTGWSCRQNYKNHMQISHGLNRTEIRIIGQMIGALHCMFIEKGKISSNYGRPVPLLQLATDWFCQNYTCTAHQYGWRNEELAGQPQLPAMPDISQFQFDDSPAKLISCLEDWYAGRWNTRLTGQVIEEIFAIVQDSLLFMFWQPHPSYSLPSAFARGWSVVGEAKLLQLLQDDGMPTLEFRKMIYRSLFPNHENMSGNELIISWQGLVVWPSILAEPSQEQKHALQLNFTPGYIRRDKERFSMVVEQIEPLQMWFVPSEPLGPATPFEGTRFQGLQPQTDLLEPEILVRTSTRGSILWMSTDMVFRGPHGALTDPASNEDLGRGDGVAGRQFSWTRAIEALAVAVHLDTTDTMTRAGEENLARRIWFQSTATGPADQTPQWVSSDYGWNPNKAGKYIATTCGDPMLALYQLSQQHSLHVVCHKTSSLIKAVSVANELLDEWLIIT